jgi:O-antigen/teichoic acid export membrane protein
MAEDLKKQTRKGLYWSAAGSFANKGMSFVFSIILARLLAPSDYGLIGMLTIFISIVQIFVNSGFSTAIITKQNRTQLDLSTAFFFNIGVGVLGYGILFFLSPYIAAFYNMPLLSSIMKVTALGVIINSLNIVPCAHYAIKLDFKTPAKISVACNLFTGALGIFLAYRGWGVWALVFQSIGGSLLGLILNWINVRWCPTFEFSVASFKYMWNFGYKVLGSSIISTVYDNIQPLIIGKFFSASSLGLFSRAQGFAMLPSSYLSGILNNVTFPILSKINDDLSRLGDIYRRLIKMSAFVCFPLMIGLAVLSTPLVKFLLPERWYDCIPILQILCFSLMWQPISAINLNLLNAAKRPDVVMKLELIKKPLGLVLLFASIPFGIIVMCYANLVTCVFAVVVNTIMTSKTLGVPFWDQVKDISPIFIHSIIMGALVYGISFLIANNFVCILVGFIIGAAYYLLASRLFMDELMQDALYMIKRKV